MSGSKYSGEKGTPKGFAFTLDAVIAIMLVAGFFLTLSLMQPTELRQIASTNIKESAEASIDAIDENVLQTLDTNTISLQQKADKIRKELIDSNSLPENSEIRIQLLKFSKNPAESECRENQDFESCFVQPAEAISGPELPEGKNIYSGQKIELIKQAPGECVATTPKGNTQATLDSLMEILKPKPIIAYFADIDFADVAFFAADLNVEGLIVDVNAKKNGTVDLHDGDSVQCDDTIDMNITFKAPGRHPADIVLVQDRSGSMSWDGQLDLSNAQDVFADGNYAFVADGSSGLRDVNIEVPNNLATVGTYNSPGTAYGVHVSGNYAYLADSTSGLRIVNVTNKASPTSAGVISNIGDARKVFVSGNYAYVVTTSANVQDFNIFSTSSLTDIYVGQSSPTGNSYSAQSFVVTHTTNVAMVDVYVKRTSSSPSSLTLSIRTSLGGPNLASASVSSISTSYAWRTASFGSPVTLSAGTTYYLVLSTTETRSNRYYFWWASTANPYANGNAYIGSSPQANTDAFIRIYNWIGGLQVIDVSNPAAPVYKSGVQGTDPNDVFVSGNYAYFSDGTAGLKIVDVSNPANATVVGSIDTTDAAGLFVSGNYAFVADGSAGLRIINISDPSNPNITATYNTPGTVYDVVVYSDSNAYVADGSSSLQVINVSNPGAPTFAKSYATPYNYNRLAIANDWVFITPGYTGIVSFNIYLGSKIDQSKRSGVTFVNFPDWKVQDKLGLVSFATSVTNPIDQQLLTATDANRAIINGKLNALVASGGTAIFDAICAGTRELVSTRGRPTAYKFQIFMTDGVSNSDTNSYCYTNYGAAYDAKNKGVKVYTIGFGGDADTAVLQQIASITGAKYYAASDENALQEVYDLIRYDIGAVLVDKNFWDRNFTIYIPLDDQNFLVSPRDRMFEIEDKNYVVFDVNLMLENGFVQSVVYTLKMPCTYNKSCDNNYLLVPAVGTYFNDESNPFDFNKLRLNLLYRDLRIDLEGLFARPLLDMNALVSNIGYKDMNTITVSFYDGNDTAPNRAAPIAAISSIPNPIAAIAIQASVNQISSFNRDMNDYYVWAVIDSELQRDCPRYNEAMLHCSVQRDTQYFIINYWVWQE